VLDIFDDSPIMQRNLSLGPIGDFGRVGNEDDRSTVAVKVLEERHDLVTGTTVQGPRRLVGQDESGIVHHRTRNDDSLLFPSGQLIRRMVDTIGQSNAVECIPGFAPPLAATNAGVDKRKLDIFQCAHPRQERRELEYEANVIAPDGRPCILAQLCHFPRP
jgi:hypothetical protein